MIIDYRLPIEHLREVFLWGTYGKHGTSPRRNVLLCQLSDDHIENILSTQTHISAATRELFHREQAYRKHFQITVADTEDTPIPVLFANEPQQLIDLRRRHQHLVGSKSTLDKIYSDIYDTIATLYTLHPKET